ncbi:LysR family transcriptional regulator [Xylophilus sp. GW821-FHT01B05]
MDRLQSMRVFERVVDEGGFAAASRALELSPAAVTRLIGDLERHLGTRLLQRTTRRLALTSAGEAYLARVRGILHDVDEAEAEAASSTRELRGILRVVATPVVATYFFAPRVPQWRALYPNVILDIATDAFPQARVEEFDASLLLMDEGFDANVVARRLWTGELIACAAPDYLARRGTPVVPQDLAGHDLLRLSWQAGGAHGRKLRLQPAVEGQGEPVELGMDVVLQAGSIDVLYHAAMAGTGVAVLSRLLVASQLASGALVELLPGWIFSRYTLYVAQPTRQLVPSRTRAFIEFLQRIGSEVERSNPVR